MVSEIRNLEKALGDGKKRPSESELSERVGARRSIYARTDIHRGEVITSDMVKLVRHAYGMEPRDLGAIIGKTALRELGKDMPVQREDICI